ncbi:transcriptional regulator, GntR family [Methylobacterium sp. 4-46]|uniref:GntR family transcriptional regulator n=1 Tax=unclassified Methylobacterium TaxID=2615210 RepID=UPI000152D976|nr:MULTISPECIES: GntR family transcriptional regulator [Methylobacterium]ACA16395.1 transcriptional regulator, GntR family [Methylobacterium sp. 4-46]WFT82106.1 GntR family transcriptional regulator [Methylobacterium nodulans]
MAAAIEPHKARRLYLLLRERIAGGRLPNGARLPGEPALAAEHGLSRATVRRALDLLSSEGLVERRAGSGTFVRQEGAARPVVADLPNLLSGLIQMGRATGVRLLSFGYEPAPAAIAEALVLAPGERVQRSVRVRLIDGKPFSYLTTHVPERIGLSYSEADLVTTPLLELMERSGVAAARATQAITATLAGPEAAEALDLGLGAPVIDLTRVVYDPQGRGVEHLHALYRPDRYALRMDLVRTGEAGERHWAPAAPPPPRPARAAAQRRPAR